MALSTVVFVGDSETRVNDLVERAKGLKVNTRIEPNEDLGPVIGKEAKERICRLVQSGVDSEAKLLLDGRNIVEEIFGPVLICMKADGLDDAINIANQNEYGNGASIFTNSGVVAKKSKHNAVK
ncbi:methylmalonate-semialdehyde dehydrogenase [acylating], mitochondrial-like [Hibiscus syriacus]|uniref:methylmalonate-semialdehyde dehydrogenase [acylating], mitochondrial-like n=1 Tax=Hibiscus syriacus TaxID=106335 RepID=UPI0019217AB4|nr:methylmalonate-semialdehyde dehydrogenase [acylating], mitochondrial-like [Hibiscus syriacus]